MNDLGKVRAERGERMAPARGARRAFLAFGIVVCLQAVACSRRGPAAAHSSDAGTSSQPTTLGEVRRGFVTKLVDDQPAGSAAPQPPRGVFELVHYRSPAGDLSAYVSPRPTDGAKRPAIIWLVGGFKNGIGNMWAAAPPENDQSARAFREAGLVLFIPSLRGGNDNPGRREILLGEVDDVVAAANFVMDLPYVDPSRVYLGGHSSGGTLALLAAEATSRFRAVFAFGPLADVRGYSHYIPALNDDNEARVRSPVHFLSTVRTPTFVIEGSLSPNARDLGALAEAAGAAPVKTFSVDGADHFSVLAPVTPLLARKILADTGSATSISLGDAELKRAVSGL